MKKSRLMIGILLAAVGLGTTACVSEKNPKPPVEETEGYIITFNANGHGTAPSNVSNVTALPAELPVLTENGWTFGGWYMDSACTIKAPEGTTITANITLYAKWTEATTPQPSEAYNITYEINGHGTQPNSLTNVTALPTELPVLTETGWTFGGWYTDSACTIKATEGTTITANITLYAKWTESSTPQPSEAYNITYEINGHGTQPNSLTNVTALPAELPVLTENGWTFGGWYTDSACTIKATEGTTITANITLYAKWTESTTPQPSEAYNITYEINGHGTQPNSLTNVTALPNELPVLTDTIYAFEGWYLDKDFTKYAMAGMQISSNTILYAKWEIKEFTIIFVGTELPEKVVSYGETLEKPSDPTKQGYTFGGWFIDNKYTDEYNFNNPVVSALTLYAKWIKDATNVDNGETEGQITDGSGEILQQGNVVISECSGLSESAYILFNKVNNVSAYDVYLKAENETYVLLDERIAYQRAISSSAMRVDLMGLKAGNYEVMILPKDNTEAIGSICQISVVEYDRSGYAHFNYTEGVGAYNDDGTLKDDAIVIYVTEENKDTVMGDIPELNQYMFNIPGSDWGNKQALGIGWWLNNAQYTKKDSKGVPGNTYSDTGKTLGLYSVVENHPVVIRFVGTVTTPEGCTAYNSLNEGGSVGDNGHMARMKDLRNITLEGVGFDAIIDGWGFHFMSSETTGERGKNFEARNLTFVNNAEDALGMEGVQVSAKVDSEISSPVKNCWIHHCTFFPGYCASPAESDKAEGDGSCDFKRGYNFTMSYCYFEYCHKTNLIGSASTSLQYNISLHHNIWYNCGSRIPLVRNSNVHFYNNLVYGDATKVSTKAPESTIHREVGIKASMSYVSSLRANAYMYSENNYFEGAKQVFETGEGGGTAKCYGNSYVSCFQTPNGNTEVSSREETVSNSCKYTYGKIDYSSFDTNPELFYYNTEKKESDCYLTTAVVAREECLKYSGSMYRTKLDGTSLGLNTTANEHTPTSSVDLSEGSYTAPLASSKTDGMVGSIYYSNITGSTSTSCKFKGQGATFTLADYATVTMEISATVNGYSSGYLVSSTGELMLSGSGSVILSPGTYFIISVQKDKETTLTALTFEKFNSEEFDAQRIAQYNEKVARIPETIVYTKDCYALIKDAMDTYSLLSVELQAKVDYTVVATAYQDYLALGKTYVETLINAIGTVTQDSGSAITAARVAYDELKAISATVDIYNYSVLTAAEEAFVEFAVQSCIDKIDAIGDVSLDSTSKIEVARAEYEALTAEQKKLITNYSKLTEAETTYNFLVKVESVEVLIEGASVEEPDTVEEAIAAYDALTSAEKAAVSNVATLSSLKVSIAISYIDAIGTVTSTSGPAIQKASMAYERLTVEEKALVSNSQILVDAKAAFDEMIVEYTIAWNSQQEPLSSNSGTTSDGFEYKANGFTGGLMKLKASSSNYLRSKVLGTTSATVTLTAKMTDTSSESEATILCTYADGTTETKTITVCGSNSTATASSVTFEGKEIATIEVVGSTNTSKNLGIESFTIVYKK